jgi:phospholipid N-methyltransferase
MSETIARYMRFFFAGLGQLGQTGAIIPSQRFLVDQMIAPVPVDYDGQIIELGAGTGALTLRLAATRPRAKVLACEINPLLARETERAVTDAGLGSRVRVLDQPAEGLLQRLRHSSDRPDFIISGIPLGNLPKENTFALVKAIHTALRHGGMYIQFQYSFLDRRKVRDTFSRMRTVPVLLNFPPAFVYYAQK